MAEPDRIMELMRDDRVMAWVMRESARQAIRVHLAARVPLVGYKDGRVVLVDPKTVEYKLDVQDDCPVPPPAELS